MKMTKLNKADREWAKGMVAEWQNGDGRPWHRWPGELLRVRWVKGLVGDEELKQIRWMVKQAMFGL